MNLKEDVINTNRSHHRAKFNKNAFLHRSVVVRAQPNKVPGNARKKSGRSSTTSSSAGINWGGPPKTSTYSSTTLNTGSSSRTTTTSEDENHVVLALTEGRGNASCEVGMAVVNITRPSIILCQLSDTQSYLNVLTKINILNPTEIIVPITFVEGKFQNRLLEKIQQHFGALKITGFARSAFNKTNGLDRVRSLCLPQYDSVLLTVHQKYYCLSAAAALLTYIENIRNVYYARESVKFTYEESEGSMIIDISAADKLELIANETNPDPGKKSNLLAVLNHCLTRIGKRTLRFTILQPPCSVPDIEARLDCVTELIKKPEMLGAIQSILAKLNNVDQLLSLATLLPDSLESYSERQLNYVLLLNLILDQISPLKEVFGDTGEQFFLELRATLSSERFTALKETIAKTIKSDAYPSKGSNATMQRCFGIKPGVNGLLDAMRKTYSEILEEMQEYVTELGRKHGMTLTLSNNTKKGFHMVFALTPHQKRTLKKSDFPEEFTQICRLSGSFTMKTEELTTYSARIEDITANILQISNGVIRSLLAEIRKYLDLFYKLVEDVSKLDVLQSLAEASSGKFYVRPTFADYTDIQNAKHPILDAICSKEPVANPIQASKEYNMHIITGPNGSGKSIYIRQVALIQIMAQVGSYIPATSATLRVCDRLFARISLEDNMECNLSTFELELLEVKHILTTMTKNSLVIIDELCRSTAVEEGTALAMAICEKMLKTPAYIFLTTHYTLITKLQEMYKTVKIWQMEAHVSGSDVTNTKLDLKYNLLPGCTSLKRYSIYLLAKMWPKNIVKYIENVLDDITHTQAPPALTVKAVDAKAKLIHEVKAEMLALKRRKQLTKAAINTILNKYQRQLQDHGVKIVHHKENRESDDAATSLEKRSENCAAASQVSFNYVPSHNSDDDSYVRMKNFVGENPEHLNYLVPEISLRVPDEEFVQGRPIPNLSYLSSQSSEFPEVGGGFFGDKASSDRSFLKARPEGCCNGPQTDLSREYFVNRNQTLMRNTEGSQLSNNSFVNAPSQSFVSASSQVQNFSPVNFASSPQEYFDGAHNFASLGLADASANFFIDAPGRESILNNSSQFLDAPRKTLEFKEVPKENIFIDSPSTSRNFTPARLADTSAKFVPCKGSIPNNSSQISDVPGKTPDLQKVAHFPSTSKNSTPKRCDSSHFFVEPQSASRKVQAKFDSFSPMLLPHSTPVRRNVHDISASSANQAKFMSGLTETSTPLPQKVTPRPTPAKAVFTDASTPSTSQSRVKTPANKTCESDDDYSISYSPLCPSPPRSKSISTVTDTSASSRSGPPDTRRRPGVRPKFVPPSKLTRREIEEEFAEQNRKMMESSDFSSKASYYAQQICNRPSVKQLQQSEFLVHMRRTEEGIVVVPAQERKGGSKRRPFHQFNIPYKKVFRPKLLSDGNEQKFLAFLENGKKGGKAGTEEAGTSRGNVSVLESSSKYSPFSSE